MLLSRHGPLAAHSTLPCPFPRLTCAPSFDASRLCKSLLDLPLAGEAGSLAAARQAPVCFVQALVPRRQQTWDTLDAVDMFDPGKRRRKQRSQGWRLEAHAAFALGRRRLAGWPPMRARPSIAAVSAHRVAVARVRDQRPGQRRKQREERGSGRGGQPARSMSAAAAVQAAREVPARPQKAEAMEVAETRRE